MRVSRRKYHPASPTRRRVLSVLSQLVLLAAGLSCAGLSAAQETYQQQLARERGHDSAEWLAIAAHLPDRVSSPPRALEQQGDVLRARRFPEDANDFYNFALQNGGSSGPLLDKLGLTELDLRDVVAAQTYFHRAVRIDRNDAGGWNNLGVVEHLNGRIPYAIADYEHALRLDPRCALFHANLAIAYLDREEYPAARREIAAALRIDPSAFEADGDAPGPLAHVVSTGSHARLSFEIARISARAGDLAGMVHALARASEAGMDVHRAMRKDKLLAPYVDDQHIAILFRNAQVLHLIGEADSDGELDPSPAVPAPAD